MDSLEELKSISSDSILMSQLERRELEDYCQEIAIHEAHDEGKALGLSEGKALGLSEGKALGLSEGKALGLSEGKALGLSESKIEIAKNMLNKQSDINFISECTGLSIEEIKKIEV